MLQQALNLPANKPEEIPESVVFACKDMASAVRLMISSTGFDNDQVGCALGYSSSHWSEILHGKKNLPWAKLDEAMDFCGSDLPLVWWNNRRGYEKPKPKQSKVEKENEELRQMLSAAERLLKGMFQNQ